MSSRFLLATLISLVILAGAALAIAHQQEAPGPVGSPVPSASASASAVASASTTPVPAPTRTATPTPTPVAAILAVIHISQSTNTPAFDIAVHTDGSGIGSFPNGLKGTTSYIARSVTKGTLPADELKAELDKIDFDHVPEIACGKSTSFGTTTTIAYKGHVTTDLQCSPALYPDLVATEQNIENHFKK